MRFLIAFTMSLSFVFGVPTHANVYAATKQRDDLKTPKNLFSTYNRAKAAYSKKGSQAFANSFSFLSDADKRYIASTLAQKARLPEIELSDAKLVLAFGSQKVVFDISNLHEGYVLLGKSKIKANFGASVEEIASAIEPELKKAYPAQFAVLNGFDAYKFLHNFVIPTAHANDAVIWGAVAMIIGGLIFKGVHDHRQKKAQQIAAASQAYVLEPARTPIYERPPHLADGGQSYAPPPSPSTGGLPFDERSDPPSVPAPSEPEEDPAKEEDPPVAAAQSSNGAAHGESPVPALIKKKDIQSFDISKHKDALCGIDGDHKNSVSGVFEELAPIAMTSTAPQGLNIELRKHFAKSVLGKIRTLSNNKDTMSKAQSLMDFYNNFFGEKLALKIEDIKVQKDDAFEKVLNDIDTDSDVLVQFFKGDSSANPKTFDRLEASQSTQAINLIYSINDKMLSVSNVKESFSCEKQKADNVDVLKDKPFANKLINDVNTSWKPTLKPSANQVPNKTEVTKNK